MTQGFIVAYQAALEEALRQAAIARWKSLVPLLFARLIHYYGTDAKLRVCRYERWIPAKWIELHRTFLRATRARHRARAGVLGSAGPNATQWTIEQEYLFVLLIHQLNTGNLSPAELDWASSQLRAWSRRLELDARAALAGRLLRRHRRQDRAGAPHRQRLRLDAALSRHDAARRPARARGRRAAPGGGHRPGTGGADQPAARRDPREGPRRGRAEPQHRPAARPAHRLHGRGARCASASRASATSSSRRPGEAGAGGRGAASRSRSMRSPSAARATRAVPDEHDSLAASLVVVHRPDVAGQGSQRRRTAHLRRRAASARRSTLGALVAVRQSDIADWVLGVVRRLNKVSNDEVEAGVSIIAERVVPVTLHAKRDAKEDMGFVVNGFDVSTHGRALRRAVPAAAVASRQAARR